jgi:alkylation response protein AidB-like acyl-CoA dehydrogenase
MSFLTYPETEQQKKLLSLAGELADTFAGRAASYDWVGRFPLENYEDLRRSGYLALTVPRDYGGWGASLLDVLLAQERLARGCASTALAVTMHLVHTARLGGALAAPNALYERLCHEIVAQGAMLNSSASEPATGSPSRGGKPTTTARRQPDGSWIITGRKTYTTGSFALRYFVVSCGLEDDAPELEPLLTDRGNFLVPNDAPGLRIEETWNSLGMRASGSNDLILEHVCVDAEANVEVSMPADPTLKERLNGWTVVTASVYLGIAQAARDEAIRFARRRRPNSLDKPISSIPHIQEKAAKMDLALMQSRAVLFGVAEQFCANPVSVAVSRFGAVKYIVTNHAVEVVDLALRMVGGASLAVSLPLQRYYRDVRAGLHNPPMDDAVLSQLGREALESE